MIECKTCENYYDFGQKLQCLKGRMEVQIVCNPVVTVEMKECSDFKQKPEEKKKPGRPRNE